MASTIGELLLKISADSAKLRSELAKAGGDIKSFMAEVKESVDSIKELLYLEKIVEAGEKLAEFVAEGAKAGQELVNMSQVLGASVEEMTRLGFAARQAGLENETLIKGIERLSRNMEYATQGGGKAAGAFKALGIEIQESSGHLRNDVEVLMEIADEFKDMQDGAGKTALAVMMFGRAGAELIPLLNQGSDGIKAWMEESDRLARTIDSSVAQAAARFNQDLSKLKGSMEVVGIMLAATLEPIFSHWINTLDEGGHQISAFDKIVAFLGGTFKLVASMALVVESGIERLGIRFVGLYNTLDKLVHDGLQAARDQLYQTGQDLEKEAKRYEDLMMRLEASGRHDMDVLLGQDSPWGKKDAFDLASKHPNVKEEAPTVDLEGPKELQKALDQIEKHILSLQEKAATLGMDQGEAMAWSIKYGKWSELLDTVGQHVDDLKAKLASLQEKYDRAVEKGDVRAQSKLMRQMGDIKSELTDANTGSLAGRLQAAAEELAASEAEKKAIEAGTHAYDALWKEVDKTSASLVKQTTASQAATMEDRLLNGDLSELVEKARAAGFQVDSLVAALRRMSSEKDVEKALEDGAKAAAHLTDAYDKLGAKTADLWLITQKDKTEYSLAHGELAKYMQAMEKQADILDKQGRVAEAAAMRYEMLRLAQSNIQAAETFDNEKIIADNVYVAKQAYEAAKPAAEKYREALAALDTEEAKAYLTEQERAAGIAKARADFVRAGGEMNKFTQSIAKDLESGFATGVDIGPQINSLTRQYADAVKAEEDYYQQHGVHSAARQEEVAKLKTQLHDLESPIGRITNMFGSMADAFAKAVQKMVSEALAAKFLQALGLGPDGGGLTKGLNAIGDMLGLSGNKGDKKGNIAGAIDAAGIKSASAQFGLVSSASATFSTVEAATLQVGTVVSGAGGGGGAGGGLSDLNSWFTGGGGRGYVLDDMGGAGIWAPGEGGTPLGVSGGGDWGAGSWFGGTSDAGLTDFVSLPGLAGGGSAFSGKPYIIGERGPELFVPNASGSIMSNDELAQALSSDKHSGSSNTMLVQLHPDAMHMTLKDWLEGELARQASLR